MFYTVFNPTQDSSRLVYRTRMVS